jgi:hypothetical protein
MPRFWLTYRDGRRVVGVVIMDAPSLTHARMKVTFAGDDEGLTFAGARDFGAGLLRLVPSTQIGRLLSETEAEELLARFEGPKPGRRPQRKPKPSRRSPELNQVPCARCLPPGMGAHPSAPAASPGCPDS